MKKALKIVGIVLCVIVVLAAGLFYFCIRYTSEKVYKQYYKDSF